jgi:hypothetical protein
MNRNSRKEYGTQKDDDSELSVANTNYLSWSRQYPLEKGSGPLQSTHEAYLC